MSEHSASSAGTTLADVQRPVLKVLGLGGGGCNAIERMIELGLSGVEFVAANTDHQALENNPAQVKIHLGPKTTRGLGAGGDPRIGQLAAEESSREIASALAGADMVFLTAGMGGGTGTGSIPVAAKIARQIGAVTIAIVTTPFSFEMGRRQRNATEGIARLRQQTNTLISIPNDRLLYIAPKNLSLETAFRLADDVLRQAVQGISELITETGLINVDFAHVRRLIRLGGGALMAIGQGQGPNKAMEALEQALHHPLLDSVSLDSAAGVIANFTGGNDLSLLEMDTALRHLQSQTGSKTEVVMGVMNDESMEDRIQVILVITGLGAPTLEESMAQVQKEEFAHTPSMTVRSGAHEASTGSPAAYSLPITGTARPTVSPSTLDNAAPTCMVNPPATSRSSTSQDPITSEPARYRPDLEESSALPPDSIPLSFSANLPSTDAAPPPSPRLDRHSLLRRLR